MIDMYVKHSLITAGEDGSTADYTRYELRPCTESDFKRNSLEESYFTNTKERKYSCIDDPNNTLSVIGSDIARTDENQYSFFELMIDRCNVGNCSDEATIDAWTQSKQAIPRILNPQ